MRSISVKPVWGENYGLGWPGFSFVDNNFISEGICWFERWEEWPIPVKVSHTFIVAGPDTCVEAVDAGVTFSTLSERFADPHTHVFFRKPQGIDAPGAAMVVREACHHFGEKYGYGLVVAKMIARTFVGKAVDVLTRGWFSRVLCSVLDFRHTADCDKVVADALNALPSISGKGVLANPAREQTPQLIFEDQTIFEPWSA